ncbi:helix-turn-helix domain-containing protein [Reichenbachiella sp.]
MLYKKVGKIYFMEALPKLLINLNVIFFALLLGAALIQKGKFHQKFTFLGWYFFSWGFYVISNILTTLQNGDILWIRNFTFQGMWFWGPLIYLFALSNSNINVSEKRVKRIIYPVVVLSIISIFNEFAFVEWLNQHWKPYFQAIMVYQLYYIWKAIQCFRGHQSAEGMRLWESLLIYGCLAVVVIRIVITILLYFDPIDNQTYLVFFGIISGSVVGYLAFLLILTVIKSAHFPKNGGSRLDNDPVYKLILNEVDNFMQNAKLFKKSDLSINSLGDLTNHKPYLISKAINTVNQKSFFEYVNDYRINYVLEELSEQNPANHTIEQIMYSAGFNSRSSFYTEFKKRTGVTPLKYQKLAD